MLYHISKIAGLKILKPQVSTHKKAYVYAIENVVTGLLFGAPHDDFDFIISEENGIPVIMECYRHIPAIIPIELVYYNRPANNNPKHYHRQ